jgi:TRAP-type C4-dicarboxylate transport system permease small subunit
MQKVMEFCEKVMIYVSTMATFVLMLLTTADAGGRYIFNRPITGAYEVTTNYLMIGAVFLAVCYGYRQGAYIRVTFCADHFKGKVKLGVNYFVQAVSLVYGILLVVASFQQALRVLSDHTTLSSIDFIPLSPAYFIIPVGLFFMSLSMLLDLRRVKNGKSSLFMEESPTL